MKRIEAGLIRKAMAEPWEKLGFALTLNLLTLTISFFSGTLWLLFFASRRSGRLGSMGSEGARQTLCPGSRSERIPAVVQAGGQHVFSAQQADFLVPRKRLMRALRTDQELLSQSDQRKFTDEI